jgi:hypothetical protein
MLLEVGLRVGGNQRAAGETLPGLGVHGQATERGFIGRILSQREPVEGCVVAGAQQDDTLGMSAAEHRVAVGGRQAGIRVGGVGYDQGHQRVCIAVDPVGNLREEILDRTAQRTGVAGKPGTGQRGHMHGRRRRGCGGRRFLPGAPRRPCQNQEKERESQKPSPRGWDHAEGFLSCRRGSERFTDRFSACSAPGSARPGGAERAGGRCPERS